MKNNDLHRCVFKTSGFLQKSGVFFPESYKALQQKRPNKPRLEA